MKMAGKEAEMVGVYADGKNSSKLEGEMKKINIINATKAEGLGDRTRWLQFFEFTIQSTNV